MTAIADDGGVHDIGGIMGGEHSSVTEATTDILIECAWFTPERIALTGQKLGLASDARSRFERGVDPAFVEAGIQLGDRAGDRAGRRRALAAGPCRRAAGLRQGRGLSARQRCAGLGRRGGARGPAAADSPAAGLHRDPRRCLESRGCRHGVATWTGRPTSSRRSSGSKGSTRSPRRRCRAQPGWRGRPRRRRSWSSGGSAGRRRRAASTRR